MNRKLAIQYIIKVQDPGIALMNWIWKTKINI